MAEMSRVLTASPIFAPADIEEGPSFAAPADGVLLLGSNDSLEVLYAVDDRGDVAFVDPESGAIIGRESVSSAPVVAVTDQAWTVPLGAWTMTVDGPQPYTELASLHCEEFEA